VDKGDGQRWHNELEGDREREQVKVVRLSSRSTLVPTRLPEKNYVGRNQRFYQLVSENKSEIDEDSEHPQLNCGHQEKEGDMAVLGVASAWLRVAGDVGEAEMLRWLRPLVEKKSRE
jgi:hypothetical protein